LSFDMKPVITVVFASVLFSSAVRAEHVALATDSPVAVLEHAEKASVVPSTSVALAAGSVGLAAMSVIPVAGLLLVFLADEPLRTVGVHGVWGGLLVAPLIAAGAVFFAALPFTSGGSALLLSAGAFVGGVAGVATGAIFLLGTAISVWALSFVVPPDPAVTVAAIGLLIGATALPLPFAVYGGVLGSRQIDAWMDE
jgi:hypothetical protein